MARAYSVANPPEDPENQKNGSDDEDETEGDPSTEITPDSELLYGEPVDERTSGRVFAAQHFSGPLPPPESLGQYDAVVPGLAREIVEQWKGETSHRHKTIDELRATDREALRLYHEGEKRGQRYALVATALMLAVVLVVAIVLDQPIVGIAGIGASLAALAWAFRRRSDDGSDDSKTPVPSTDLADGDQIERRD